MKTTHALRTFLLGSTLLAVTSTLHAADGTWNVDTTPGLWSTAGNWTPGIADGSGFTANFTNNITGDRTVRLDSDRTLTSVVFGDSDTLSAGSWLLDNNGTGTNNLILAGTTPGVTVNALGTGKTATISAIIEGSAGLVKSGDGTLVLSGANAFTGNITVNGGTLQGGGTAFGNGVVRTFNVNSGAAVVFAGPNVNGNALSANNNLVISGGTLTNSGSSVTGTGGACNALNNVTLGGGTLTSTSSFTTGDNWGAWSIQGNVTSTGTSTISSVTGGHIRLKGNAATTNNNFDVQSGTLTVSASLWNGKQSTGGFPEATTSLTKLGAGTMTLSATNLYTGSTTVSAGKLTVSSSGNINTTSAVSIGAGEFNYNSSTALTKAVTFTGTGGTLSGSATINLPVNVTTGNTLAIGNSVGTMNFVSTLTVGGTYLYELDSTLNTGDLGDVAGVLTLGGVLDLVQLGTFAAGDVFTLFAYDDVLNGFFKDTGGVNNILDDTNFTDAGGTWRLDYDAIAPGVNGGVGISYVTITAVPEPSAALLGSLGMLALLRRRR